MLSLHLEQEERKEVTELLSDPELKLSSHELQEQTGMERLSPGKMTTRSRASPLSPFGGGQVMEWSQDAAPEPDQSASNEPAGHPPSSSQDGGADAEAARQ